VSNHDLKDSALINSALAQRVANTAPTKQINRLDVQPDPVDQVACRVGDSSCAAAHASTLSPFPHLSRSATEKSLLRLQKQYGNGYVGRVLHRVATHQSQGDGGIDIERSIESARGGGHGLDHPVRGQMEAAFGANFGDVRIHTDARADTLNHAVAAKAFTTGKDIFFRQGEYSPGTSSGRELLAHELTHVVQQTGDGIQRKMTVSQPGDPLEVEADSMARSVMQQEHRSTPRTEPSGISRQEEEETVQTKAIDPHMQRQPEQLKDEEEKKKKLQMKGDGSTLSRQEEEEQPE
jgi:hypothetical protein